MADDNARHTAGALDIRSVIGFLLAVYGVILLALGLFADTEPEKTGDVQRHPVGRDRVAGGRRRPIRRRGVTVSW